MESHQRLHVFLARLRHALIGAGMSNEMAAAVCDDIRNGTPPRSISTANAYQGCWVIYDAMQEILTTLNGGSKATAWFKAIAHRIFDYEDCFRAKHGYAPLNARSAEYTEEPCGRA
jgi:hypothetical protein